MNPTSPPDSTPGERLEREHRSLNACLAQLICAAREGDPIDLRVAWRTAEHSLLTHFALEEELLLPVFARRHPDEAALLLAEHAAIKNQLLEIGLNLELHIVRAEDVECFARSVRDHGRREERTLYRWAGRTSATSIRR